MKRRCVIKRRMEIYFAIFVLVAFKTFVRSIKYGADTIIIEDMYNMTIDYNDVINDKRFALYTKGCMIPLVDGSDTMTKKYFYKRSKPPVCQKDKYPLLTSNETHIIILNDNFKKSKFLKGANSSNVKCCYKPFHRPKSSLGIANKSVDDRILYSRCTTFKDALEVKDEFVKVNCFHNGKLKYRKFFIFTPEKNFTTYREFPFSKNQSAFNILVMGLASVSRQNFHRTMLKTYNLLNYFEAVELKAYNTIAEDTFQNMIAFLIGMNSTQLHKSCWTNHLATLDSCPFIWERFKDMGYFTALAEDSSKYGIFNTKTLGFRGTPTDYYVHPFIHESEILNTREGQLACMGDKYYFEVLLNYIDSLTTRLNSSKLFGIFWEMSMSYNNIKNPIKMDDAYAMLIEKLHLSGYLKKTILILISDHGMNIGDIKRTKEGRLEQRLPLVYILLPKKFRERYKVAYQNLQHNRDRLTTPFDLHSTLIDLLDMNDISDDEIIKRTSEAYGRDRGISLFLKVPLNRTCAMAGIDKKWCSCYKSVNMLGNSSIIAKATSFLSHLINGQLKPHSKCLKLTINKIVKAYELKPGYEKNKEWRYFIIIISTMPGGGVFEVMLKHEVKKGFTLASPIKRLNTNSRNQCVDDEYIKIFCNCKHKS